MASIASKVYAVAPPSFPYKPPVLVVEISIHETCQLAVNWPEKMIDCTNSRASAHLPTCRLRRMSDVGCRM